MYNHVIANILVCQNHFKEVPEMYIGIYLKTYSLSLTCSSYIDASFKTVIFSKLLKGTVATSAFINEVIMKALC